MSQPVRLSSRRHGHAQRGVRRRVSALLPALGLSALPALGLSALAAFAAAPSAVAAERVETPIVSSSPQTDIVSSAVRIRVPLPASSGTRPEACDWLSYMRYRSKTGPSDPTQADAVAVLMPGLIEGATAFDPVARNTIREAKRRGKTIEVWGLDRRANCLEDRTGIEASEAKGDIETMLGYYYGKQPLSGKTFPGFAAPNAKFLADLGVAQTVKDYYAVLTNELPSQPWREKHVICGGHSMGGPLTEAFAAWDFDGNPATTADAGWRQCAGFMGFDTALKGQISGYTPAGASLLDQLSGGFVSGLSGVSYDAIKSGIVPRYIDLFGIGPETMGLLEAIGYLADTRPGEDWSSTVAKVPNSGQIKDFLHLSGSVDFGRWALSSDSMRDYRYSYAAALGQIMDDNGAVFGLVRSSFGFFDNAGVRKNQLPAALGPIPGLGTFVKPGKLVLPTATSPKPIIGWRNYDALNAGSPVGTGWTTPADEVTDFRDFARILHEGPLSLTENYFPIRLFLDLSLAGSGDRSKELVNLRYSDGVTRKPRFVAIAGDGLRANEASYADPIVKLPGYQHLDVLTAAERQNNGQPEGSSQAFANLIDQALAAAN